MTREEAYQLEYEKPQFCEDCISREQADKAIQELAYYYQNEFLKPSNAVHEAAMGGRMFGASKAREIVLELPSVLPKAKTGHWVHGEYCSECGCDVPAYIIDWKWQKDMDAKFCPNCGADMREVEG